MMSDGVLQNLKDCGVEDILAEVQERLQIDTSVRSTAQGLVDAFARKHDAAYCRSEFNGHVSNRREEMTVIFVNLADGNKSTDTFDSSSITSSLETTLPPIDLGPIDPYVDLKTLSPHIRAEIEELLNC